MHRTKSEGTVRSASFDLAPQHRLDGSNERSADGAARETGNERNDRDST